MRDYERLRWILNAAEQQVPSMRAELLQALDDRVQELLRAEVELRTASALASVQPFTTRSDGTVTNTAEPGITPVDTVMPILETAGDRPAWVTPQDYRDVEQAILSWKSTGDLLTDSEQKRRLSKMILGVEGTAQRQTLTELLQEQVIGQAQAAITAKQAEADALFVAPEPGPPGEGSEDSAGFDDDLF